MMLLHFKLRETAPLKQTFAWNFKLRNSALNTTS